jgi:hypothetical protein
MANNEAIVDTCFIQKLSSGGDKVENIKLVLDELGYNPVVHPYIAEHELSLYSYSDNLVKTGYIRKIDYNEFLRDDYDKSLYEGYFKVVYEDMHSYLEASGGPKQVEKIDFEHGFDIYNSHRQGSSFGDVHMILMAAFLRLPIILSEDSDIELLRTIAKKRVQLGSFILDIYNGVDLIKKIAEKEDTKLTKKDLESILLNMGERKHRSEMKAIWNENHGA